MKELGLGKGKGLEMTMPLLVGSFLKERGARPRNKRSRASVDYRMRMLATDLVEDAVKLFHYRSFLVRAKPAVARRA